MSDEQKIPTSWLIASDFDPNQHMLSLKGKDYLTVQNRLLWFVRDQRNFISRGLATTSYVIRTELVEQDIERGFAQFKTFVRDVLGNEATMYGSETAKDFGDYAEKASTKSLGRALWALGYGTGMAPEMDESEERPVDSPVERKPTPQAFDASPKALAPAAAADDEPATPEQQERMRRLHKALGITDKSIIATDYKLRGAAVESRITGYMTKYQDSKLLHPPHPPTAATNGARHE